jgi:hypothetical protein
MALGAAPAAVGLPDERPLRRGHLPELAVDDGDGAPCDDQALYRLIAQRLLVAVALAIAIEDAAHRRVAPVDDADPCAGIEVLLRPDEHVTAPLFARPASAAREHRLLEPQVREVRALPIERAGRAFPAVRPQRPEVVHLLEQRGQVLGLGRRRQIAELEEPAIVVRERLGERARGRDGGDVLRVAVRLRLALGPERAQHDLEQAHLLSDDAAALLVVFQPEHGLVRARGRSGCCDIGKVHRRRVRG